MVPGFLERGNPVPVPAFNEAVDADRPWAKQGRTSPEVHRRERWAAMN